MNHQTDIKEHAAFPRKEYAGLILDCDGTLTDSMPVHFLAWREAMENHGIELSEARFYKLGGMPTDKIIRMLAAEQEKQVDVDAAAKEKEENFLRRISMLTAIEPVKRVADYFRHQIPIAVASGGYREVILKQIRQVGCEGWFQVIVTAEDTSKHKPEPDVFLEAAKRLGVPPEKCLVYEDSDLGIEAAGRANMDVVDVREFHTPKPVN